MKKIIALSIFSLCAAQQMNAQWSLSGNAVGSGDFLGTTNNMPILFKTNGMNAGRIEPNSGASGSNGNAAIGLWSLNSLTTGNYNCAFGFSTLFSNTAGHDNSASGISALYYNVDGNYNTATGSNAMTLNTGGSNNTSAGWASLYGNKTGNNNSAFGSGAMNMSTGSYNTATGSMALGGPNAGNNNSATGYKCMYSNTSGGSNTANGAYAMFYNTTGYRNTAIGDSALWNNITGYNNTGTGFAVLINNSGNNNTANGINALVANTSGSQNSATGSFSMQNNTTGYYNTANGYYSMLDNTTGGYNAAVGAYALYSQTTGSYNSAIGYGAYPSSGTISNWTGLGYYVGGGYSTSNMVELGNSSVSSIRQEVASTIISDGRIKDNVKANVPGLDFINRLRPVTYNLNIHRQNELMYKNKPEAAKDWDGKYDIEKITQTGFIAQEVEKAANDAGYDFNGVDKPTTTDGLYGIRYVEFVMPLVKSVQELSKTNDDLKKQNDDLQQQINELRAMVLEMKQTISHASSATPSQKDATTGNNIGEANQSATLGQNVPNPFTGNTTIICTIPGSFSTAAIKVLSLSGSQVGSYPIFQPGSSEITVNCSNLATGMYVYSLVIDGKVIDTKKMLLNK